MANVELRQRGQGAADEEGDDSLDSFLESIPDDSLTSMKVSTSYVRLGVTEGKYRMVRRILHNAGHSVIELHRVRYGGILLGPLVEGDIRRCTIEETSWGRGIMSSKARK